MSYPSAAVRRDYQAEFANSHNINNLSRPNLSPVLWGPFILGLVFALAASALLLEDAYHRGFTVQHALQPILVIGAAAAGIYTHHAFASWRFGYGLAFLLVAIFGSLLIVYGTMGRQADAREGRQADARLANEKHASVKDELDTAKKERDKECRSGFGDKCKLWQGRVDALTTRLAGLKTATLDPRAEALGDFANLVGLDRKRTMDIVSAVDPIALPMWLELGSIVFLGASFPPARKRRERAGNSEESETLSGKCDESVSVSLASEPLSYTKQEALKDFRSMRSVPSQKVLAMRWARSEGTVSKWLAEWESDGLASRGARFGKERAALALPAPR